MTKYYNVYFLETESRLTDDLTTLEDAENFIAAKWQSRLTDDLTTLEAAENFIATKCPGWTPDQLAIREEYCIYAHSESIEAFRELLHMDPTHRYTMPASISGTNAPKEWFNHEWWFDSLESAQQFMSYLAHLSVTLQCPAEIKHKDMTIGIV
jgi:hypothetical protein